MTHSLNRFGLDGEEEIVVLCIVDEKRRKGKRESLIEAAKIMLQHKPANIQGVSPNREVDINSENINSWAKDVASTLNYKLVTAVFNDVEVVKKVVKSLKDKNLGLSVVLSGMFNHVNTICTKNNLKEHTYNISLGIFGKKELLPEKNILKITTQCGHGFIGPALINDTIKKIATNKITLAEGARAISAPCTCGISNPKRIEKILAQIIN